VLVQVPPADIEYGSRLQLLLVAREEDATARANIHCTECVGIAVGGVLSLLRRNFDDFKDVAAFECFEKPLGFRGVGQDAKKGRDEGNEGDFAVEGCGDEFHAFR